MLQRVCFRIHRMQIKFYILANRIFRLWQHKIASMLIFYDMTNFRTINETK